ncbi:MAG: DUF1295 domain-containing protein [Lewinellaceae bacterium]|nr:DUF1295 domain-containing protein [Lewinellaceae bacterium]
MIRTTLLLVAALLALPVLAFYYDIPLDAPQQEALRTAVAIMCVAALICYFTSEITRNYSQVDKLWSLMPILYTWYFSRESGFDDRLVLMAILVTAWGLRLSANFARRDGYHPIPWKGEEDYRWSVLRQHPVLEKRLPWMLFNLFFISFYQHTLILLFCLPALVAWQGQGTPLNLIDIAAAVLMFLAISVETLADQQQYEFQTEKHRRIREGLPPEGDYAAGFCRSGLWAYVRHPNYVAEQAIWLFYYLFGVAATGRWLNWSLAGVLLLMLLFIGSSDFSEKISASKYPEYRDYQRRVPRFFPGLPFSKRSETVK